MKSIKIEIANIINRLEIPNGKVKCGKCWTGSYSLISGHKHKEGRTRLCWFWEQNGGIYGSALDKYIIEDLSDPSLDWEEEIRKFVIEFVDSNESDPIGG